MRNTALALLTLVVLAGCSGRLDPNDPAEQVFPDCASLLEYWPNGVRTRYASMGDRAGMPGGAGAGGYGGDTTGAISAGKVAGVTRSEGRVYQANRRLDTNEDGLACGMGDEPVEG